MKTWWRSVLQQQDDINNKLNNLEIPLQEMIDLQKSLGKLRNLIILAEKFQEVDEQIQIANELISEGLTEIASELRALDQKNAELNQEYEKLLKQMNGKGNKVILEIRAGAGGQEASLFAKLLVSMYQKYSIEQGWSWEVFTIDMSNIDGCNAISSISISIEGEDAFYLMEYESGVHRVQRVPITESCGRIHTSTATVAVLAEPEEADVKIYEEYLRMDVFRASGAGGQHVNKTESAVRLTYDHPDLGKVVVSIQDEKSQHRNREKAMKILRARVAQQIKTRLHSEVAEARRNQIGSGDRSEKIRTYNFQQNRVTDHRSGISVHNIQEEFLLLPKDLFEITKPIREARVLEK